MASTKDLRLLFIASNKEPVALAEIEALMLRAFASSFCIADVEEMAGPTIGQLSNCYCSLQLAEAEDGDGGDDTVYGKILRGAKAEDFYYSEVVRLYMENGADRLYAEESAEWPEMLPSDADYMPEILTKFAELDVGHELVVKDYLQARARARKS
jgi:hypothetical protein